MTKGPEKDALDDDDLDGGIERRRRRRRGAIRVPSDNVPRRPTEPRMEALEKIDGDTPVPPVPEDPSLSVSLAHSFGAGRGDEDDRAPTSPVNPDDERSGPVSPPRLAAFPSDGRVESEGDWDADVSEVHRLPDDDSGHDGRTREMPAVQLEALGLTMPGESGEGIESVDIPLEEDEPVGIAQPAPVRPRAATMALSEEDLEEFMEIERVPIRAAGPPPITLPPPSPPPPVLHPPRDSKEEPIQRPLVRFHVPAHPPQGSSDADPDGVTEPTASHATSGPVRVVFNTPATGTPSGQMAAAAGPPAPSSTTPGRETTAYEAIEVNDDGEVVEATVVNATAPPPPPSVAHPPPPPPSHSHSHVTSGSHPHATSGAHPHATSGSIPVVSTTANATVSGTANGSAAAAAASAAAAAASVPSVIVDDDDGEPVLDADLEGEVVAPTEASDSGEILTEDLIEEVEAQAALAVAPRPITAEVTPPPTATASSTTPAAAVAAATVPATPAAASPPAAASAPSAERHAPPPPPRPTSSDPHPPPPPAAKTVKQSAAREAAVAAAAAPQAKKKKKGKPWFEEIFDEDYLRTLPFLTPRATQQEAAFVTSALDIPAGSHVLDLGCGYGRHAMELAQRGYHVVALDLSLPLLLRGADEAQRRGLSINFVHGDMRELSFDAQFDGAYCVFSTFGYFDDETNKKTAMNLCRALKPGGRVVLEILNRDYLIADLPARVWWEGDGCVVLEEVDFNYFSSRVVSNRSVVFDDGRQLEHEISVRAYSLHEFGKLLHAAGFRVLEISGSLATRGRFFGAHSREIIVVAEKRGNKDGETTQSGLVPK